ncbi:Dynamin-like GTPase that mediates homotypic ER fusion [Podila epicladia]|nr:Dynamin-like GTPase that mediates homotypic ER fusion [Podila epicladia]KAG0096854.1 Dynamin-like GTPase that mediates homotypic ER fusion [Podila epicladia]
MDPVPDIDYIDSSHPEDGSTDHLPRLHLIDEEKKFRLFGTNFDVMSENARKQTTKGIWISKGRDMKVLVMDVEGTDGREHGEDQDFERKSALFSVSTSEVLIVNMWEHQVGLYNGANMGLLKTVFEVNLQLFGSHRGKEKTLLFFVIRDHVGSTPLANLSSTLRADLDRIWHGLSKPEGLENCKITDYFDFMFTTLPHKLLQPEQFETDVEKLRLRFMDPTDSNYVFQPQYSKRVPADGLHIYASGIWDQIMANKDLDLPTQQELLAQFRCDEIANTVFAAFRESIKGFRQPIESGGIVENLGAKMKEIRGLALKTFDKDASRYHVEVYKRKRAEMLTKANTMLEAYYLGQLKNLHKKAVSQFSSTLQHQLKLDGAEFSKVATKAKEDAITFFTKAAKQIQLEETDWGFEEETVQLEQDLQELATVQREKELGKMVVALEKQVKKELEEPVKLALDRAGPGMWGRVVTAYLQAVQDGEAMLERRARTFDLTEEELEEQRESLKRQGWVLTTMKIQEETVDGLMVYKLLNWFEEKFQRDESGLPRVWKPDDDIDTPFRKAREETVSLVPLYSKINPLDPSINEPLSIESTDDFDFDQSLHVISESRQQELVTQLRRKADASYVEAKRSVVATQAKIPYWVGVAIILLGWNEFVTVITNPIYLTLTIAVGIPLAALWYLDMLGLVQTIGQKVYDQGMHLGLAQLRQHFDIERVQAPVPVLVSAGGVIEGNGSRNSTQRLDDRQESESRLHRRPQHSSTGAKEDDAVFEMRSLNTDKKSV